MAFASTSILYVIQRKKRRMLMMMLRIYEHLRVSLVSIRSKYYATEESTRIHTKKLWHVYPFYAVGFRINFNNKKLCIRISWKSTVGGRSVNKLNLSSLYHFFYFILFFYARFGLFCTNFKLINYILIFEEFFNRSQ